VSDNRPLFRRGRVLALGASSFVAASAGLLGNPKAAVSTGFAVPNAPTGTSGDQGAWRGCVQCDTLFYDGEANKGVCPIAPGAAHRGDASPQTMVWLLHYDARKVGRNIQYDWRFCQKCFGLFYDGLPDKGRCAAGGGHLAQGLMFGLTWATTPAQQMILSCHKCRSALQPDWKLKSCPAGGIHLADTQKYWTNSQPVSTAYCQYYLPALPRPNHVFRMHSVGWTMSVNISYDNLSTQTEFIEGRGPNGEDYRGQAVLRVDPGPSPNINIGITWDAASVPNPALRTGYYIGRIAPNGAIVDTVQFSEKNPRKVPWTAEPNVASCVYTPPR
jgi:hypothetical protein